MNNLDKILPFVQKPSRYINHEINSHKPDMTQDVSICLCFPDIYEVGASNLGIEILYHLINEKKLARCERSFAPDVDLENIIKNKNISLFSLESKSSLKSFDIVGFTLQCELVGTNIVNMLSLSEIPVFSKDRNEKDPIIIGGGPAMANPEPFCDFFDLFVIGDGEKVLPELIEIYRESKKKSLTRKEILKAFLKLEGIYVPSFYEVSYNQDNTVKEIKTVENGIPENVKKTTVELDKAFFHKDKIVPFVETVHNRLNIEIARGCIGRCRFCQASKYYRPWRTRNPETIMSLVDEGLKKTGYEDIAFSSLSCTDYKNLENLLCETNEKYAGNNLNISLPSMRCNTFSLKVAEYINRDKKPTITFAPEAGSDRLRNVIGKYLSEKEIINTLITAYDMGWRTIKLYFMIGLPTETKDDIEAVSALIKKIKQQAKGLKFNITVSPFVPKAQTAFQWEPMFAADYIKETIKKIKNETPATIKAHDYSASILEAVLARGDRRLSKVIYLAWQKGLRFDQWSDKFNFETWKECLKSEGLDLDFYVYRKRDKNEIMPWHHIELGVAKEYLYSDYLSGIVETGDSEYDALSDDSKLPKNTVCVKTQNTQSLFRVLLKFSRKGAVKYISHLEQIDFLRRVIKRTQLPVSYTAGFSPQIKMSFGPAISVGYESDCEYADLYFTDKVNLDIIKRAVAGQLPEGYAIEEVKQMPLKFPAADMLVNLAEYYVRGLKVGAERIKEFLEAETIPIVKIKKGKESIVDAKSLIAGIEKTGDDELKILLRFGQNKNLKLSAVLGSLSGLSEDDIKILNIKRNKLYAEKNENIYEI